MDTTGVIPNLSDVPLFDFNPHTTTRFTISYGGNPLNIILDAVEVARVERRHWFVAQAPNTSYITAWDVRTCGYNQRPTRKRVYLHTFILRKEDSGRILFLNGLRYDYRKVNLLHLPPRGKRHEHPLRPHFTYDDWLKAACEPKATLNTIKDTHPYLYYEAYRRQWLTQPESKHLLPSTPQPKLLRAALGTIHGQARALWLGNTKYNDFEMLQKL